MNCRSCFDAFLAYVVIFPDFRQNLVVRGEPPHSPPTFLQETVLSRQDPFQCTNHQYNLYRINCFTQSQEQELEVTQEKDGSQLHLDHQAATRLCQTFMLSDSTTSQRSRCSSYPACPSLRLFVSKAAFRSGNDLLAPLGSGRDQS